MPSRVRRRSAGYVMVLFAMFLFGLLALAALVIDLGIARLTQRQMQTAADVAALEGLRGKGFATHDLATRQNNARLFAELVFDDDLDRSNGDMGPAGMGGQFGAGPMVEFQGGAGDPSMVASQLMVVDENAPVYKPEYENGNLANSMEFRVGLARGAAVDADEYHLISSGPAVPYLFGRGAMLRREVVGRGITVRGESRAIAASVKSVGFRVTQGPTNVAGLAMFCVEASFWNSLQTIANGQNDVNLIDPASYRSQASAPIVIGRLLARESLPSENFSDEGYVAIFQSIQNEDRVIGFGYASIAVANEVINLTRITDRVAPENASASLIALPDDNNWRTNPVIRQDVLAAHQNLQFPLYAPALAR